MRNGLLKKITKQESESTLLAASSGDGRRWAARGSMRNKEREKTLIFLESNESKPDSELET